jgi:hypothetical protein
MGSHVEHNPEVFLYDFASTKGECYSGNVWRIRLMLNYKRIPYKTIHITGAEIESTLKSL